MTSIEVVREAMKYLAMAKQEGRLSGSTIEKFNAIYVGLRDLLQDLEVVKDLEKNFSMKITIYAPVAEGEALETLALGALLAAIPKGSEEVLIQAPPRRPVDLKACLRPGWLELAASVDNKTFIHVSQQTANSPPIVKVTR